MLRLSVLGPLGFCLAALFGSALSAAPLDPASFTSLGTMNLAAGTYTVNSSAMTLTGPGANFTGVASGNICVFCFASITIQTGAIVNCSGTRTVAFLSQSTVSISGLINGDGGDAQVGFTSFTPAGGPGGGAGGLAGNPGVPVANGAGGGTGGGSPASGSGGAGGGGFGSAGSRGGDSTITTDLGQPGGIAYGNLATLLEGGSGGGGGEYTGGGGGGGGIEVGATGNIDIASAGIVSADGGDGEVANYGASGGGSGGGIYVHTAGALTLAGTIRVRGGGGGKGGC
ncbi:hypothetical protein PLCT1_00922 [Planctomycetaceae bacterium]|nr:hypothetical protein PLCT1_00922 [Planctomycetaceae bacterium]